MDLIEILLTYLKYNGKIYQYPKDEKTLFPYIFFIERNVDMMNKKETKEKICAFYASDYHFEMISLPYISKSMDENKEIIILTENNLEDTVNILISKMNLDEIKKEKILSLDWNNNDLKKFKEISKKSKENSDMVIFIKGKQNYIDNINENIEKWVSTNKHIKIIDCYEFFEIEDKIDKIANEYSKVLGTSRL